MGAAGTSRFPDHAGRKDDSGKPDRDTDQEDQAPRPAEQVHADEEAPEEERVSVLVTAVERGGETRDAVAAWIGAARGVPGLTGDIGFDGRGNRTDRGVLFTVVEQGDGFAVQTIRK